MSVLIFCTACSLMSPAADDVPFKIDSSFPGGNVIVEGISGDTVNLRPDLRDTKGGWFYWYFQVSGAAGRTLTFNFTHGSPVGVRGPGVSTDQGKNWRWLGTDDADEKSFTYTFPASEDKVRFSFGMPYTQADLDRFLDDLGPDPALSREVLCKSRKGRDVERLRIGRINGEPRHRVLVTARSHACEMMMSYTVEGIIRAVLAKDERGSWFRENVEMLVIPFVDKDGVEDGDQGKNRAPHDHNRDYDPGGIYPETQALLRTIPAWAGGRLRIALDLHCPHIRGEMNEHIYLVGHESPAMFGNQTAFCELLERHRKGPLIYQVSDNLPFGESWNTAANYKAGTSGSRWMASIPGVEVAGTFELPYANARGGVVNAETSRAFGVDLVSAIMDQLKRAGEGGR
jgi:hypothetical protein